VAVIPDAERLAAPAQNALLKLLEEPPEHTVIIMTAPAEHALLATTVSRCQVVRFGLPTEAELRDGLEASPQADELLSAARRLPGLLKDLQENPETLEGRKEAALLLQNVLAADAAGRLAEAKKLSERTDLDEVFTQWLGYHQEALHGELEVSEAALSDTAAQLAQLYSEPQLRHNITALFAARDRLRYNPNVLLLVEQTLLTLGE
jgi:DNA polymerase III gamma/tau subunit